MEGKVEQRREWRNRIGPTGRAPGGYQVREKGGSQGNVSDGKKVRSGLIKI